MDSRKTPAVEQEFKEPKRKKRIPGVVPNNPFPITFWKKLGIPPCTDLWPCYNGFFDGEGVIFTSSEDISDIHSMGCFGKKVCEERGHDPHSKGIPVMRKRQWEMLVNWAAEFGYVITKSDGSEDDASATEDKGRSTKDNNLSVDSKQEGNSDSKRFDLKQKDPSLEINVMGKEDALAETASSESVKVGENDGDGEGFPTRLIEVKIKEEPGKEEVIMHVMEEIRSEAHTVVNKEEDSSMKIEKKLDNTDKNDTQKESEISTISSLVESGEIISNSKLKTDTIGLIFNQNSEEKTQNVDNVVEESVEENDVAEMLDSSIKNNGESSKTSILKRRLEDEQKSYKVKRMRENVLKGEENLIFDKSDKEASQEILDEKKCLGEASNSSDECEIVEVDGRNTSQNQESQTQISECEDDDVVVIKDVKYVEGKGSPVSSSKSYSEASFCIVIPDSEDETDRGPQWESDPTAILPSLEWLQLFPEEAFFLAYALGCVQIWDGRITEEENKSVQLKEKNPLKECDKQHSSLNDRENAGSDKKVEDDKENVLNDKIERKKVNNGNHQLLIDKTKSFIACSSYVSEKKYSQDYSNKNDSITVIDLIDSPPSQSHIGDEETPDKCGADTDSEFINSAQTSESMFKFHHKPMNLQELWNAFRVTRTSNSSVSFESSYAVYHHFRSKGWVVKPGIRFGGDFLLYKDGPSFYHASYLVVIDASLPHESSSISWNTLAGLNRLAENVAKELLICRVNWPEFITESQLWTPKCLNGLIVEEIIVKRWVSMKEREAEEEFSDDDNNSSFIPLEP